MANILRDVQNLTSVTVRIILINAQEINYERFAGGQVYVPSGSSLTLLTWHTAENEGGTYLAAYDANNVAVTQVVAASRSYPIPVSLFGASVLKIQGNADGTVHLVCKG